MLKVGLIGAGYLGKIHLRLLTEMKDIEFKGFFDLHTNNAAELSAQYNVKAYAQCTPLIQDCDVLIIASPTTTHFDYAIECINAGKHVFVEKPVTSSLEEARQLKQVLDSSGCFLQIGMVERFNPAYRAIVEHVQTPIKIFCNRLAPFTPRGADVSVVFDVMIHDIDLVLSLVNSEVKSIKTFGQKIISDTYDVVTAIVEFETGTVAHFTASRCAERKYRWMEVFDKDCVFQLDLLEKRAFCYQKPQGLKISLEDAYIQVEQNLLNKEEIVVSETNAIGDEVKSFIQSIINNKKVVVSLDDGIRAMQVAGAIEAILDHQN